MKASAICSALLAAPVLGAALHRRQLGQYQVSDFTASCIPHSLFCSYDFFVTVADSSTEPTHCTLMLQGPDLLPSVEQTGCEDATYSWSVAPQNGSLGVTVTSPLDVKTNLTGLHLVTKDQLAMETHEAVISQYYKGPQNFTVGAESVAV